ncbi:MAG: hypothetical protein OEX04_14985, partial [Acidimicrobiia bacterium]|nr:hypothetical protein [Acidimicrobiia bacterium]
MTATMSIVTGERQATAIRTSRNQEKVRPRERQIFPFAESKKVVASPTDFGRSDGATWAGYATRNSTREGKRRGVV